jgi:beta-xylosidase
VTDGQVQKWAIEADRMVRLDGRTYQQIEGLIDFSQNDNFWFANILSMGKLREQFDQLTNQRKRKQQTFINSPGAESPDESPSRPKWVGLTDDNGRHGGER